MLATAFLKNRMPLERYQMAEHHQTGVNLTKARVGYMFLPSSAKDFVPDGVVSRTTGFSIGPLDVCSMVAWQCRPVCSPHPQPPQGHQEGVIRAKGKKCGVYQCRHVLAVVSGLSATRKLVRNGFWGVHQIGNDARKSVSSATLES